MKRFSLNIIGKTFAIEVEREEKKRFLVKVNGKKYQATLEDDSDKAVLMAVDGGLYTVERDGEPESGKFFVKVNERKRVIESRDLFSPKYIAQEKPVSEGIEIEHSMKVEEGATQISGLQNCILAPLPGKVVAVKVSKGDEVEIGDVVVILEAMKMENEIISNFKGKIFEIRVKEGDTVDADNVLVIVG